MPTTTVLASLMMQVAAELGLSEQEARSLVEELENESPSSPLSSTDTSSSLEDPGVSPAPLASAAPASGRLPTI